MSEYSNQIIFLGTGTSQGVPYIGCEHPVCLSKNPKDKRLRSSVMIQYQEKNFLIDCGPDFRTQMLRENLSKVDAILITHEHNDHIIGLDDVRPINFKHNRDMRLYSMSRVLNEVKMRFPYAFKEEKYPGVPGFELFPITQSTFNIDGIEIAPLEVKHGELPILGYRIGNLAYLTDVSSIPEPTLEKLQNLDILVIDSLRKERPHHSHLILEQSIAYAQKIDAKKTYFTHINQEMGFHDETEEELPNNIHLAYDGLRVLFT